MESTLVAVPSALLLSTGHVLRDGEVGADRHPRRGRRLGQVGKESDSGSAAVNVRG